MRAGNFLAIAEFNVRLIYKKTVPLAAAVLLLIPLIYGVSNLDSVRSADSLERMVVLAGIPMFVPLIKPEQQEGMSALIMLRPVPYRMVIALRIGISLAGTLLLILAFETYMRVHGCTFPFFSYAVRTLLASVLIGLPGLLAGIFMKNTMAGFLVSSGIYGISQINGLDGIFRIVSNGVSAGQAAVLAGLILAVIVFATRGMEDKIYLYLKKQIRL